MKNYSSNPCVPLPEDAKDVYEIAQEKNISLGEAVLLLDNMIFVGYNDFGQEIYVSKKEKMNRKTQKYEFYHGLSLALWLSLLFSIFIAVVMHSVFIVFIANVAGILIGAIAVWFIGELVFWIIYHD